MEPENIQAQLILASTYTNLEEYSLAVPILEDILEKEPSNDQCYFLLYEINHIIGDLDEARRWLELYPKSGKRIADTYQLLGELAEEEENIEQAVFYYNQLIASAPTRKWTHFQLVRVLHADGNVLTALQQAETALEQFKEFSDLALLAGNIAFGDKFFRQAERFYHKAYTLGNAGGLVGLQNLLEHYTL
ncbi:MAG: tetratricopeptide repeat protein, partial [bacterium]|nr:tetratricopeptide repeat protein [bacterium]